MSQKTRGNGFLNGIDEKGTWLAKFFAKICTYGLAYAVIYLAIQSVLPQLRNGIVYGVAMTIVMAAPELMIGGLTVEAMEKLKENKVLGSFLFVVAALFLSIGILTMFDIFVWHFADGTQGQQALSLYRAIVVLLYSAVHGIVSKLNEQREEKVQQVTQANDELALSNQQKIEESDKKIDTVYAHVEKLEEVCTLQEKYIQKLEQDVQHLENHIQNSAQTIDTTIDNRIEQLSTSVTEITQNILQITQNNQYNVPAYGPPTPLARDEREDYSIDDVTALPALIEQPKILVIPALEVAGMDQERITEVLTFFLSGTSWTKTAKGLNLNYSRDVKPIKEAYERSLEESVHTL